MSNKLTPREERFCELIAAGMGQHRAYTEAGFDVSNPNSAGAAATRLLRAVKIVRKIEELRQKAAETAEITLAWLQQQAREIMLEARNDGAHAAATSALKELAILTGHRVEKREQRNINDVVDLDDEELVSIARAGSDGAIAAPPRKGGTDCIH